MTETKHPILEMMEVIVLVLKRKTAAPEISHEDDDISLRVEGFDQGRFIGKKGRVIWAIQTLCWHAGTAHNGIPTAMHLLEPLTPSDRANYPFLPEPAWDRKLISRLVNTILAACLPDENPPYVIDEDDETRATVIVKIDPKHNDNLLEPSFEKALSTLLHAAGMALGASIQTEIRWA